MKNGFTLFEVVIVILILAGLAAIAIPSFVKTKNAIEDEKNGIIITNIKVPEGVTIAVIDGCQYLQTQSNGGYYFYTHKANCTNHIVKE